jgi:hypothetical protein
MRKRQSASYYLSLPYNAVSIERAAINGNAAPTICYPVSSLKVKNLSLRS